MLINMFVELLLNDLSRIFSILNENDSEQACQMTVEFNMYNDMYIIFWRPFQAIFFLYFFIVTF